MQRRRPGAYAEGQVYNIYFNEVAVRPSRAQDAVRAVFSKGGACYDCHTIFAPQAGKGWRVAAVDQTPRYLRSEEHTSELQSLMRISYAVFCLKKKKENNTIERTNKHSNSRKGEYT